MPQAKSSSIIYHLCRRQKFIYHLSSIHLFSVGYSLVIRLIYVSYLPEIIVTTTRLIRLHLCPILATTLPSHFGSTIFINANIQYKVIK